MRELFFNYLKQFEQARCDIINIEEHTKYRKLQNGFE